MPLARTHQIWQAMRACLNVVFIVEMVLVTEDEVLAALDKPMAVYALLQRVDPSSKSTDALQDQLMRMRTAGKVKFDIKTGKWAKA